MERASSESSLSPFTAGGEVTKAGAAEETRTRGGLLLLLSVEAAAFVLAMASGKMPEVAVVLFRALLTF